jgi:simple sugar transport system permease protein
MTGPRFPQVFIAVFLLAMFLAARALSIPLGAVLSDSLIRLAMNGVLVLSLVPMINAGIGINFGLPVGIGAGLLGMCIAVNFRVTGLTGFFLALLACLPVAVVIGYVYAQILLRAPHREEITATFVGFAFIFLLNFFWATAPFSNPTMLWPIGGKGLRPSIGLASYFAKALNSLWSWQIGSITIPIGLLFFFALLCAAIHGFFKTKFGRATLAVGENEAFARLSGVNVKKVKVVAIIFSTLLAAFGICVYAQSYGFIELYDAPLMMAFPAASAILVGGCLGRRATVMQVILGAYLFQTVYILSGPLANELLVPEVSEIIRMMVVNGMILWAFLHKGQRDGHVKD